MTMQTEEPGTQDPAAEQTQQSDASVAAAEERKREKELQDRLAAQGRQVAELRRTNEQLATQLAETNAHVRLLGENMTQQQRDADARREAETQAYLESLPEDSPQRLREEVRLSNERVKRLEAQVSGRNGGPQVRDSGSPQRQSRQESPQEYQTRRMKEIIAEAQDEFGVTIDRAELEAIPEEDWEREGSFHRAIFATAARKANAPAPAEGDDVANANKGKATLPTPAPKESAESVEDRVRRQVLRELGVSSPAGPRAAATRRTGPAPTEEDVKEAASTYNSSAGPKANIKALKELRSKMG